MTVLWQVTRFRMGIRERVSEVILWKLQVVCR